MRHGLGLAGLALMLAASSACADILPEPDRGPPAGNAGGLNFAIRSIDVIMGPANGPTYHKTLPAVVLVRCTAGRSNCNLARSRNLIGMKVLAVEGHPLQPRLGMVAQIISAFEPNSAAQTVTLELVSLAADGRPIKVSFARR